MPIVGVEKCYIAVQTADTDSALAYGTPALYDGVQEIDIKPKQNTATQYAENRVWDQATAFDSIDVTLKLADLSSAQRAVLLGQTLASIGGVYSTESDVAPYVALLYKATIRGGYRYGVIYKGVFTWPEDSAKGQEGKIEFQSPSLAAMFQSTKNNGMVEYHVETTDPDCPIDIDSTWFNAVAVPGADTTLPTVTTAPADAASGVADTIHMTWTFSKAIDPSKVSSDNFFLLKSSDGTLVAGTLTLDGTSKIVTLIPSANLSASTAYVAVCTASVSDLAGNKLASTSICNFTSA
jgi:phi13 family phage major tail protein